MIRKPSIPAARRWIPRLDRRETCLLATFVLLVLAAVLAPELPTRLGGNNSFADSRAWGVLPNALDVLSNLPFALIGAWGLVWLHRFDTQHGRSGAAGALPHAPHFAHGPPHTTLDCAWLFFSGLLITAVGSAFFHLHPDAPRLAADRAGMAVAFAGLIGVAVCERVSARAGWLAAWFSLAGALLAVAVDHESGNLAPWVVVQFGGMGLVLGLTMARPVAGAMGIKLGWVVFFYALAKLFELGDGALFSATGHAISGHTLKHLTAALAALPVLQALQAMGRQALGHNAPAAAGVS